MGKNAESGGEQTPSFCCTKTPMTRMVTLVLLVWCLLLAASANATASHSSTGTSSGIANTPHERSDAGLTPTRAAALTALASIARHHPERVPRLLAAFAAAAAAASDRDSGGDGDGGGGGGGGIRDLTRTLRWEIPPEAADWSTPESGDSQDLTDSSDDATEDTGPMVYPSAAKRALSVLSRWQPFTSLANGGRRASRFASRARPGGAPRDFISAETRGDFGDRPLGQPMRWGRR